MGELRTDIDFEQNIPQTEPGYIEVGQEIEHIETHLVGGENLIQKGPPGIGKTLSFEYVAYKNEIPRIVFDCSKDTKKTDLIAQTTFGVDQNGNRRVEVIPGIIPKGILAANKHDEAMIVFEEINCLPAGTPVMTPEGEVPIEDVEDGETVVSYDTDTNQLTQNTVTSSFKGQNRDMKCIHLSDGRELEITADHKVWTKGGWKESSEISEGECMKNGSERVCEWTKIDGVEDIDPKEVYNITVDGDHNYFANGLLVHNSLMPNLQKLLNQVSDYRQGVEIPRAGEYVSLNQGCKILVGGTMNPSSITGGTYDLNSDLRSRFDELKRDFPTINKIIDILEVNGVSKKIGNDSDVRKEIASFIEGMHSQANSGEVSYFFTPRDGVRLGKMWEMYYTRLTQRNDKGMNETKEALRMASKVNIMGKYDSQGEKDIVGSEIEESFTIQTY